MKMFIKKLFKKDRIIIFAFIVIAIIHCVYYVQRNSGATMPEFIEQTIIIFLAYVGLLDFFYMAGWNIFVPDFIIEKKKQERIDEVEQGVNNTINNLVNSIIQKSMKEFFEQEVNFMVDYSEQKIQFIMSQLGINSEQFNEIKLELIKLRCLPLKNLYDARKKVLNFIKIGNPMVIDLKTIDPAKRTYKDVDYYLNFNDAMYFDDTCREFVQIMHLLICEKIGVNNFDRIVIPYDSNAILGVEIGKSLGKPVVKMRKEKGRVEQSKRWDGEFNTTDRLLIVHDVLVSGDQIIHVPHNVPKGCTVTGLCCLAARTEGSGLNMLKNEGIRVERILDLSDSDIESLLNNK